MIDVECQENDIKGYIPRWALPRENIPINVEWQNDVNYDEIRITKPDDFNFVDFLNVENVKISGNVATVNRVIRSLLAGAITYFGFLICSKGIYDDLKVAKTISIEFIQEDVVIKSLILSARIFRPSLKAIGNIEEIELLDDVEEYKLPINLKYTGFGDIRLCIVAKIGAKIVSQGDSIIYGLLKLLWMSESSDDKKEDSVNISNSERGRQIIINDQYLQKVSEDLERILESGEVYRMFDMLENDDIKRLKKWISDMKNGKRVHEFIRSRIEDVLLGLLSDLFDKYPTENVKLANVRTKIKAEIKMPVTSIEIYLKYTDILENEYPMVEIPMKVSDKRNLKKNTVIEIPITIEKLEDEPFLNVSEMKIEGEF